MEDSGFVVNFSVDEPSAASASAASSKRSILKKLGQKGWKQRRMQAKKMHRSQNKKTGEKPNAIANKKSEKSQNPSDDSEQDKLLSRPSPMAPAKQHRKPATHKGPIGGEKGADQPQQQQGSFISSLFTSNPEIPTMPDAEQPTVSAPAIFNPDASFPDLGLNPVLVAHLLDKMEIQTPTNIQRRAVPVLLDHRTTTDVIVKAQTGSGKTLAFLLPILNRLMEAEQYLDSIDRSSGVFAVVLSPTRELAQQIYNTLEKLLQYHTGKQHRHWIVPGIVMGGDKRKSEKARLRKGVNILISTPGRLLDHLKNTDSLNCRHLKWLVLDEADRLLDLGFEATLIEILGIFDKQKSTRKGLFKGLPSKRQTVLCSATINGNVKELAKKTLEKPLLITEDIKSDSSSEKKPDSSAESIPSQLIQEYAIIPAKLRLVSLVCFLQSLPESAKAIVYLSCCDSVEFHYKVISESWKSAKELAAKKDQKAPSLENKPFVNAPLFKLHGSLDQKMRSGIVLDFLKRKNGVLFCTDVAARGLDIPNISHIVQYDAPVDPKDYVHRAGRTARIGKEGSAIIFLQPSEADYVGVLRQMGMKIDEKKMDDILGHGIPRGAKKRTIEVEKRATDIQMIIERFILSDETIHSLAKKAYASHIRAYATHMSEHQAIFHIKRLHLGHIAKSFGLRDAPTGAGKRKKSGKKEENSKEQIMKRNARRLENEFGDGIVPSKKIKVA